MTSQPGLQTIAIHISPNISQSKGNHTMTFCELIEYNRNAFLRKLYTIDPEICSILIFQKRV